LAPRAGPEGLRLDAAGCRRSTRRRFTPVRAGPRVPAGRRAQSGPFTGTLPWAESGRLGTGADKGNPTV
ncbi:hypothetical protein CLOM_g16306, partial [Closterium sp. NIES-68]